MNEGQATREGGEDRTPSALITVKSNRKTWLTFQDVDEKGYVAPFRTDTGAPRASRGARGHRRVRCARAGGFRRVRRGKYIGPFSDRSGAFVGGFTGGRARFSPFPNSSRRGIPPNSAVCPSCHRDRTVLAVLLALICVRLYKSAAATGPGVRSESLSSFSRPTSPGLVFVGSLRRVPSLRWPSSSVCVLWVTSRRLRPR